MGKFRRNAFFQLSHTVLDEPTFKILSFSAQLLFIRLCKLRNRLGDASLDQSFWRTDRQLLADTGFTRNTLKASRLELIDRGFLVWISRLDESRRFGPRYYLMDDIHEREADSDALKRQDLCCGEALI